MAGFQLTLYGRIWVTPKVKYSRSSVYMTENVHLRLLVLNGLQEFRASEMLSARLLLVKNPEWRPVSDEHIQTIGNQIPILPGRCAARIHEGPVQELRCIRRSPEVESILSDPSGW